MTENKQYTIKCDEVNAYSIWKDNKDVVVFDLFKVDAELICNELNNLYEEKEFWKSMCCNQSNFNQILLNELDIAQEQGYEVSNPFKKLMEKKERLNNGLSIGRVY